MAQQIGAEQALLLKRYVQTNSDTKESPLVWGAEPDLYKAWFVKTDLNEIVNIQKEGGDKLGISIDVKGRIRSLRVNDTDVTEIPAVWLLVIASFSVEPTIKKELLLPFKNTLSKLLHGKTTADVGRSAVSRVKEIAGAPIQIRKVSDKGGEWILLNGEIAFVCSLDQEYFVRMSTPTRGTAVIMIQTDTPIKLSLFLKEDGDLSKVEVDDDQVTDKSKIKPTIPMRYNETVIRIMRQMGDLATALSIT